MIYACIDIGSNTTRLLVADTAAGGLRELLVERVFTRIGRSLGERGRIPADKVAETADVVCAQAQVAREMGAREVVAVATAAIRDAANRDELVGAVQARLDGPLRVLTGTEEARLSFVGATRTLAEPAQGKIAVVDVGGGSTEIAIGSPDGTVEWSESFRVGSGFLTDSYLRSDPPAVAELEAVRRHVSGLFEDLSPPQVDSAMAVGGTATSLARLVGGELEPETLAAGMKVLSQTPRGELAERYVLDPERVRLLPAGIVVLEAVSGCLGLPLQIARGGLREGVVLELTEASAANAVGLTGGGARPAPPARADAGAP